MHRTTASISSSRTLGVARGAAPARAAIASSNRSTKTHLPLQNLPSRVGDFEPSRAIDLRKGPSSPRARRPFHLERYCCGRARDPSRLRWPTPERPCRPAAVPRQVARNLPNSRRAADSGASSATIRPFGMLQAVVRFCEQNFEIAGASSKQEQPGALRFPQNHRDARPTSAAALPPTS
jgi:hypothetical protein